MKHPRTSVTCLFMLLCMCSTLTLGGLPGTDRTAPLEDSWQEQIVSPQPGWSKSKDGFSAMLVLSDEPDDVLQSWTTPSGAVPVRAADSITRGVPIVAFVFFAGCAADDNGLCNASADFIIRRPDGSEYESFGDRDLWKGRPAPPEGMLRLSAEYVGVIIEPGDPLGRYEVLVSVHDLNSGTTLDLKHAFTAIDGDR